MTADPTQVRSALEREVIARRGAQAHRAERARLGEIDLEIGNTCPECGPDGAGGGEAGMHPGFVPVTRTIPARTPGNRGGEPVEVTDWRPCYSCRPERWAAWQENNLRGTSRPKVRVQGEGTGREEDRQSRARATPL